MVDNGQNVGAQNAESLSQAETFVQAGRTMRRSHGEALPLRGSLSAEPARNDEQTHTGWFHRSGDGKLRWAPADVSGNRARPPELIDLLRDRGTADSPASPGPYPVGEVKGRSPAGLDDFLGVASFTVRKGDLTYRVFGTGERDAGVVRFRQKDLGRDGRDIRTWLITATDGGITAAPDPVAVSEALRQDRLPRQASGREPATPRTKNGQ